MFGIRSLLVVKKLLLMKNAGRRVTLMTHALWKASGSSTAWAKKTGPFLNVDNFTMVSGRKACDVKSLPNLSRKKV